MMKGYCKLVMMYTSKVIYSENIVEMGKSFVLRLGLICSLGWLGTLCRSGCPASVTRH